MKKVILYLSIVTLFLSCGKKSNDDGFIELTLKPETTEVSGDMEGCFKVVDREYKSVKGGLSDGLISIELQRTDLDLPFTIKKGKKPSSYGTFGIDVYLHVGFGIEFLDKDGNILDKVDAESVGFGGCYSSEDPIDIVMLNEGKKASIRFSVNEEIKDAVSFRITSAYEEVDSSDLETSSDNEDNEDSYSNSSDWDKVLDDYEEFTDSYIKLLKKVSNGDMSSYTEMNSYMSKAESISDKLENAQGNLTAKQLARFEKIQAKLLRAASNF